MTSTQNVIPVHFPAVRPRKKKPSTANAYLKESADKARAHVDFQLIDTCVRYCVTITGAEAGFNADPTDSHFAEPIDAKLLRNCRRLIEKAAQLRPQTIDGLRAKAHVALLVTDPQRNSDCVSDEERAFLNTFAADVIRYQKDCHLDTDKRFGS